VAGVQLITNPVFVGVMTGSPGGVGRMGSVPVFGYVGGWNTSSWPPLNDGLPAASRASTKKRVVTDLGLSVNSTGALVGTVFARCSSPSWSDWKIWYAATPTLSVDGNQVRVTLVGVSPTTLGCPGVDGPWMSFLSTTMSSNAPDAVDVTNPVLPWVSAESVAVSRMSPDTPVS
jgi:hypothetical protein